MSIPQHLLSAMRQQLRERLPGTAILQAVTRTGDGAGGYSETWTPVAGGTVPCRLDPAALSRQPSVIALAEGLTGAYQLTLPFDAPLAADHRLLIDGAHYEIRRLAIAHDWNLSIRVLVVRLE